jgi:hypothetical protein
MCVFMKDDGKKDDEGKKNDVRIYVCEREKQRSYVCRHVCVSGRVGMCLLVCVSRRGRE